MQSLQNRSSNKLKALISNAQIRNIDINFPKIANMQMSGVYKGRSFCARQHHCKYATLKES